jgi:hypothetical protein
VKQEDLYLGRKVYDAQVVDLGIHEVKDVVVVTEYTVTKAGKKFFELKSARSRVAGAYQNMGDTLGRLRNSPAEAIDRLERRNTDLLKIHKARYERDVERFNNNLKLVQEWRNKRGL